MTGSIDFRADVSLLSVLSLAPFVAIAWAEADVDDAEKGMICSWANEAGLTGRDAGYVLLEKWLTERPSPDLLACWKRQYVDALSRSLSREARRELKHHVLDRANALIQATGAFSGVGQLPSPRELAVIREIERALS